MANEIKQGGTAASSYGELEEHAVIDGVHAKKVFPIVLNPLAQTNPSLVLTYTSGDLTKIEKTINAVTYEKMLTWTGGVLTAVSSWSQI